MTVFCQQLRRWRVGGGHSEPWRFEGCGSGTWELDRRDVIAGRRVAFLVVPRPVDTEDPRRRPTQSVGVLQELVVDSTGVDHATNDNDKLRHLVLGYSV